MDKMLVESAKNRQQFISRIHAIFASADHDGNGRIDYDEFAQSFEDPTIQAFFRYLDIDLDGIDVQELFNKFDFEGNGEISADEFCAGCTTVKGYARSIDLTRHVWHQHSQIEHLMNLIKEVKDGQNHQMQEIQ